MIEKLTAMWHRLHPAEAPAPTVQRKKRKQCSQEELEREIWQFLFANDQLYHQIVLFQDIEMDALLAMLQSNDIKCSKKILMGFLDREGIHFSNFGPSAAAAPGNSRKRRR